MTLNINAHQMVLTVEEAGKFCRLSRNSMYAAIARGELPSIRVGRRILIPRAALVRLLAAGQENLPDDGQSL